MSADMELVADSLNQAVDEGLADQHALLSKLVAFRSENPMLLTMPDHSAEASAQERACQSAIAGELRQLGHIVDDWEISPGRRNVVGRRPGEGFDGRSLILNGHVDVVPVGDPDAWDHDPWAGDIIEGRMRGRGTSDMKGGLVAAIGALRAIDRIGLRLAGDVVFQSVVDEETGGFGTRSAIERGYRADAAVVLEPTSGSICPAEGGLEWVNVVVAGSAGHSAQRYQSIHAGGRGRAVNAIEKAMKVLQAIQEYERYLGNTKVHSLLPPGITTINPGMIAGGIGRGSEGLPSSMKAYSNMADYCVIGLSLKYLPSETIEDVKQDFETYIAAIAATDPWLRVNRPLVEWGVSGVSMPPCETPSDHPLLDVLGNACRTYTGSVSWAGFEAKTDLTWLVAAGIPGAIYGPGSIDQAHIVGEFIELKELEVATRVLARTIVEWCGAI